jgi:hypothetical protein
VFVKRILDKRPVVVLARRGAGVDHPSAAANVAALVEVVAARPGRRILNSVDPDAPSALEISRVIAAHVGHTWEEVLLEDTVIDGLLGRTPWDPARLAAALALRDLSDPAAGPHAMQLVVTSLVDALHTAWGCRCSCTAPIPWCPSTTITSA